MRDIYAQASGATVWLGNAADDSERVISVLESIGTSVFNHKFDTRQDFVSYVATLLSDKSVWSVGAWKALQDLFSRPYRSRLWVIQEIALSVDSITIVCGSSNINWPFLVTAINVLATDWEKVLRAVERIMRHWVPPSTM
jgi:hypothetical protein